MKKHETLARWREIAAGGIRPLNPGPVPYKHKGTTYAEDGIRITGRPEWIEAVLSRLIDLLDYENGSTRLALTFQESKDRETGAALGSMNCYIQVHDRGGESQMMHAFLGHKMTA